MTYFVRSDLEPYVGKELTAISYLYPMGTSGVDGRYADEYEEVEFYKITDRCVIIKSTITTPEDEKFTDEILIPIEHIVSFKVSIEVDP